MPNFKNYDYDQAAMVVVNFLEQLQPGTFEFTPHQVIEDHIDLSVFYEKHQNDQGGYSAYDLIENDIVDSQSSRGSIAIGCPL